MLSQILRFACVAAVGFPVAYAIAPGDLGVALRRLGVGDKIAVMVDLTIRFIPTIASSSPRRSMRSACAATTRRRARAGRSAGCAGWRRSSCR